MCVCVCVCVCLCVCVCVCVSLCVCSGPPMTWARPPRGGAGGGGPGTGAPARRPLAAARRHGERAQAGVKACAVGRRRGGVGEKVIA